MKIAVPDWLKNYGPPLSQQLRDAGFDASFDTSPGLDSQVQTGQQPLYFNCQGPAGVKGMDPYFMLSIFEAQYYRPTGEPAPFRGPHRAGAIKTTTRLSRRSARCQWTIRRPWTTSRKPWISGAANCR